MIARTLEIGIIVLVLVWSAGAAVSADNVTPVPTLTPSDIVITDNITPYFGPLGPDSPLYGLKLAWENLDEAFTFNTSEKVTKEMQHADLRIAEAKGLLLMNRSADAGRALDAYSEKMNLTAIDLSLIPNRTAGLAEAYQQHVMHELALRDLIQENPNSTALWRAYNQTLDLEGKFAEKSDQRIDKLDQRLNRMTIRVERFTNRTPEQAGNGRPAPDHGNGRQFERGPETTPVTTRTPLPYPGRDNGRPMNGEGPR